MQARLVRQLGSMWCTGSNASCDLVQCVPARPLQAIPDVMMTLHVLLATRSCMHSLLLPQLEGDLPTMYGNLP